MNFSWRNCWITGVTLGGEPNSAKSRILNFPFLHQILASSSESLPEARYYVELIGKFCFCHCPLLPGYSITCSPVQTLAAMGVCLACTVMWWRAVGLLNKPSRFVHPCRGPWALCVNNGGSFMHPNGPGCEWRAPESIHPAGHANMDAGVYKCEETRGNTIEQWHICYVYEHEGLGGVWLMKGDMKWQKVIHTTM